MVATAWVIVATNAVAATTAVCRRIVEKTINIDYHNDDDGDAAASVVVAVAIDDPR